jgi:hypothetical protein
VSIRCCHHRGPAPLQAPVATNRRGAASICRCAAPARTMAAAHAIHITALAITPLTVGLARGWARSGPLASSALNTSNGSNWSVKVAQTSLVRHARFP